MTRKAQQRITNVAGGRPPKYETAEELEQAIELYFETDAYIESGENRMFAPTVTGLAYALGMSRQALLDYENNEKFLDTIKRAKQRIGVALEQRLYGNNVTGIIFNLKNNFGWKDARETSVNAKVEYEAKNLSDEELERIAATSRD